MPSVTIELTAELAGRMCSFVHTAMIDGGRADRRASRVIAMMRSIIPTGSMEASETAPAIDIPAVGGGYRGGGRCLFLCVSRVRLWPIPEMTAGGRGVRLLGCTGRA